MVKTYGLTHLAIGVSDPERALRFYEQVLGVVPVYREQEFIQAQTPGSRDVIVFQKTKRRTRSSGSIAHFGFRLVDPVRHRCRRERDRARGRDRARPRRVLPRRAVRLLPRSRRLRSRDLARDPYAGRSDVTVTPGPRSRTFRSTVFDAPFSGRIPPPNFSVHACVNSAPNRTMWEA